MEIRQVRQDKKRLLPLLLLADEQEDMIDRYIDAGDSPATVPFYEECGFKRSHIVKNFFPDHYDHPIYECGTRSVDMIYLRREL